MDPLGSQTYQSSFVSEKQGRERWARAHKMVSKECFGATGKLYFSELNHEVIQEKSGTIP